MKKRVSIKKIIWLAVWTVVISGLATLLVAANRKQADKECMEIRVAILSENGEKFVDEEEVLEMMHQIMGGSLVKKQVSAFDLARIEKKLQKHPWISGAELYIDAQQVVHVKVVERNPVARLFTTAGASFFIDSAAVRMPLLEGKLIQVPVITGFVNARHWSRKDSALLKQCRDIAMFIGSHPFWNAQIGQIDINSERSFELVPVVGSQIIKIGKADKIEDKLKRLMIFYQQVLAKKGMQHYQAIDLRFEGQVVAVRRGSANPIDSIQLKKNIEELVNRASLQTIDDEMLPVQQMPSPGEPSNQQEQQSTPVKTNSGPPAKSNIPPTSDSQRKQQQPRAVMPSLKRN